MSHFTHTVVIKHQGRSISLCKELVCMYRYNSMPSAGVNKGAVNSESSSAGVKLLILS